MPLKIKFENHQLLACQFNQTLKPTNTYLNTQVLPHGHQIAKLGLQGLHNRRQFWPPKRGSKTKASNQAAFIGLPCTTKVLPRFYYAQPQCFATLGTRDFQGKPANPANLTPSDLLETCLHTTTALLPPQSRTDYNLTSKVSAERETVRNAKKFAVP